uniref:C-type lectin domain-containing protein n=1 Tax=Biomphalaria glabrata TaxID=6526 RepID=A0A2C9L824_BIOGL
MISFAFSVLVGLIVFGLCAQSNSTARSQTVDLYQIQRKKCIAYPGFSLKSYGSTLACVWQSATRLNFTMARSDCEAKGASLCTVNTVDKLQIARSLPGTFLVGLNDNETEQIFVFDVDNTVLDENLKKQLFATGQPDDENEDEDCAVYYDYFNSLNDISCSRDEIYVCEQFCFVP